MTLDEAISHAREKAKDQRERAEDLYEAFPKFCVQCAEEHEQLADWLTELKAYRGYKDLYEQGRKDAFREVIAEMSKSPFASDQVKMTKKYITEQLKGEQNEQL